MAVLKNRAGMTTTTVGTGAMTLGAALGLVSPNSATWQTLTAAGVADGDSVRYLILDSNGAWEYGTGTYTAAGTTLSRPAGAMNGSVPGQRSSTGALLNLTGGAQVFIVAVAEDIVNKAGDTMTGDLTITSAVANFKTLELGGNVNPGIHLQPSVGATNSSWIWQSGDILNIGNDAGLLVTLDLITGVVTFSAAPIGVTPAPGDNSTKLATTAFVATSSAPLAPLASPTFTGDPKAPTPAAADNDTSIATTAFVKAVSQPLDDDLTALAALGGTNTIYYRSGAGVWSPVTIGPNISFSGGVLSATSPREVLTGPRTYFVRADGNDANTGLANTAGGAWATLAKAKTVLEQLDMNGFNVTVQVGPGTYTSNVTFTRPLIGGVPLFQGDITTPTNVIWSPASGGCLRVTGGARINIAGFEMRCPTLGDAITCEESGSAIAITGNMRFGPMNASGSDIAIRSNATVDVLANYSILGQRYFHCFTFGGGRLTNVNKTVTVAGATTALGGGVMFADVASSMLVFGLNFTSVISGRGAFAQGLAIIHSNNDSRWLIPGTYPGNVENFTVTGGLIV